VKISTKFFGRGSGKGSGKGRRGLLLTSFSYEGQGIYDPPQSRDNNSLKNKKCGFIFKPGFSRLT